MFGLEYLSCLIQSEASWMDGSRGKGKEYNWVCIICVCFVGKLRRWEDCCCKMSQHVTCFILSRAEYITDQHGTYSLVMCMTYCVCLTICNKKTLEHLKTSGCGSAPKQLTFFSENVACNHSFSVSPTSGKK